MNNEKLREIVNSGKYPDDHIIYVRDRSIKESGSSASFGYTVGVLKNYFKAIDERDSYGVYEIKEPTLNDLEDFFQLSLTSY